MRVLFLLHGAPGSGKSSLIHQLGVEDLTLGYDHFRTLFSAQFPCVNEDGSLAESVRLGPDVEPAAVHAAQQALTARLKVGTTVFFDSTMMRISDQNNMVKLANSYGYKTYLIDCQGSLDVEILLERNRHRGVKRVDEQVLRKIHAACAEKPVSPFITGVIDGTRTANLVMPEIFQITKAPKLQAEQNVIVVGDVHSCAEALQEAVDTLDDGNAHWVFVGDLFDRGPDAAGVWKIVTDLISQDRGTVATGNHELNLRAINTHTAQASFSDTRRSRNELLAAGIFAAEQTAFVDASVPLLNVRCGGQSWIVTHGGVGAGTLAKLATGLLSISDAECVYGLGDRAYTYRGKSSYNVADMPLAGFQLHGHRNGRAGEESVAPVTYDQHGDPVICLEAGVSAGGKLAAAVLGADGSYAVHQFDDRVNEETAKANSIMPWERKKAAGVEDVDALLERMHASEHINVRAVKDIENIAACNFTRKAFQEGAWTDLTMHARGLFIDEEAGKIVARGYEKFFHISEAPGRELDAWMNASITSYPVVLRKKYNGYLALVASVNGALQVFSKSGVTDYSRFARDLLAETIGEDGMAKLAKMLERTNTTAAFEVIAARDTHPITESGPDRLVLLDCIRNQVAFATDDSIREGISRRFGFDAAEVADLANTPEELEVALREAAAREDEGVVLVDARGYRSKVKADRYAERKAARTALERVWRGKADTLGQRFTELESRLIETGVFAGIIAGEYTVTGVDGNPRLDMARVFDRIGH